jgi:predicted O-methyltransferase YrrM
MLGFRSPIGSAMSLVKRLIKVVAPLPVLNAAVGIRDRAQLIGARRAEFDPSRLIAVDKLDLDAIFADEATARSWRVDGNAIGRLRLEGCGSVNPGDRRALYYLIGALKPKSMLEIGTHTAASTLHMAGALKRFVPGGRLITLDIQDVNGATAAWSKAGLAMAPKKLADEIGCSDYIKFVMQPSLSFLAETQERFHFVFVDGDHSPLAVYLELAAALRLLQPGGAILLHDYYPNGRPLFPDGAVIGGPFRALDRIMRECPSIRVLPLGALPWPTKQGVNVTSLALIARAS